MHRIVTPAAIANQILELILEEVVKMGNQDVEIQELYQIWQS